jgi:SAM-dependent methyltransferase
VHLLPGFLNIDIAGPADLVCDVREDIPLESSCSEFIFSEHLLEHLDYPRSARKFVAECYRLLQVGGTLVIGVPDARPAVLAYAAQDQTLFEEMKQRYHMREISPYLRTPIEWLNFVFRDESCSDKYSPHLWAYDFESLVRLVSEAGFREAKRWDVDDSLINPKRKPTTVYVQALK